MWGLPGEKLRYIFKRSTRATYITSNDVSTACVKPDETNITDDPKVPDSNLTGGIG